MIDWDMLCVKYQSVVISDAKILSYNNIIIKKFITLHFALHMILKMVRRTCQNRQKRTT